MPKKVGQRKSAEKSWPQKVGQKKQQKGGNKRQQKMRQERWGKSLLLNLSCCCLETCLKPFLLDTKFDTRKLKITKLEIAHTDIKNITITIVNVTIINITNSDLLQITDFWSNHYFKKINHFT